MSEDAGKPTTVLARSERPGLFEAVGVEIECMIVDAATLDVAPLCDRLMEAVAGEPASEVERGALAWSNELTLHVLELKTNGPAPGLRGLATAFHRSMREAGAALEPFGARLLPGPVHPWMDPARETVLWPHEYTEVYHAFDRIFGCSGHGWSNLQSTHLNLPFADDEQFGRLHAAIRLVLPLIPGLSAASPYLGGRRAPALDARLDAYAGNARRVPSVSGQVVPEPAFTRAEYEAVILEPLWADLAPLDPEGVLRHEWVNARGAIARFDRGAVEIRVIDAQECPTCDLAILAAVVSVVRALTEGSLSGRSLREDPETGALAELFRRAVRDGEGAMVDHPGLLGALGLGTEAVRLGRLWRDLLDRHPPADPAGEWTGALEVVLDRGPLGRRLLDAAGEDPGREGLCRLASELAACLDANVPFEGAR